jgi:hypothetical protein
MSAIPLRGLLGCLSADDAHVRAVSAQPQEVPAEPLAHLPDRPVHLGHAPRAEDERVLARRQRADLGNNLEVGEPAAEVGALAGKRLVLAELKAPLPEGSGFSTLQG